LSVCANCSSRVPTRALINGKNVNLRNRKYCLECKPFGTNNTSPFRLQQSGARLPLDPENPTRICAVCTKPYQKLSYLCASCQTNIRRFKIKRKALEYLGGRCVKCGYNKCSGALVFHHIDPTTKEFSISGAHSISWKRVQKELDKCQLLCQNCHTEHHWEEHAEERKRIEEKFYKMQAGRKVSQAAL
jgi:hypothetical protein